jgi:hypothetical protein
MKIPTLIPLLRVLCERAVIGLRPLALDAVTLGGGEIPPLR